MRAYETWPKRRPDDYTPGRSITPRRKPRVDPMVVETGMTYPELVEFQRQQRLEFLERDARRKSA